MTNQECKKQIHFIDCSFISFILFLEGAKKQPYHLLAFFSPLHLSSNLLFSNISGSLICNKSKGADPDVLFAHCYGPYRKRKLDFGARNLN